MFDELMKRIDRLRLDIAGKPELRWGVVTAVSPLAVRLDGDTGSLAGSPSTLVGSSRVGDRVQLAIQNRRATIVGIASGGDTGWVNITPVSPFAIYGSTQVFRAKRVNGVVYLEGMLTCNTAGHVTGTTERIMGVLPTALRPATTQVVVCQGSGSEKWTLAVNADGTVTCARYTGTQSAGVWLPFSTSFLAA